MNKLNNLKALRESRGLLQKDVAAKINVNRTTYVKYENGDSEPSINILKELASFFDVSIDYLLGLTDDPVFAGGPLASFIKQRRGNEAEEDFAKKCGISTDLLQRIESGFRKKDTADFANQQSSLSSEDMKNIAEALSVDWQYIACLYSGYNPNKVNDVITPNDDRTGDLSHQILHASRYQRPLTTTKKAPSTPDEARFESLYEDLNKQGQKKLLEYAADLMASGLYANSKTGSISEKYAAFQTTNIRDQIDVAAAGGIDIPLETAESGSTANEPEDLP